MSQWPKQCGCCPRSYTPETWILLPLVGAKAFDVGEPVLEYRNCVCGSTLAIELPANDVDQEAA